MEKIYQYKVRVPELQIFALSRVPKAGESFRIADSQLRYEIKLSDPYLITYLREVNEDGTKVWNERLSIEIRGHVTRKYQTLLQGETLLLYDPRGSYVVLYRIKNGVSHFINDDVTILLEGMCVEERGEGDQLMSMYIPDHFKVYRVSDNQEEIIA